MMPGADAMLVVVAGRLRSDRQTCFAVQRLLRRAVMLCYGILDPLGIGFGCGHPLRDQFGPAARMYASASFCFNDEFQQAGRRNRIPRMRLSDQPLAAEATGL